MTNHAIFNTFNTLIICNSLYHFLNVILSKEIPDIKVQQVQQFLQIIEVQIMQFMKFDLWHPDSSLYLAA